MSNLTAEQIAFLENHNISTGNVFDATGLSKSEYREEMKQLGKLVAIGVTPCQKAGHTIRSRSGHCVECNPAAIAFQNRHTINAYVYVAGSKSLSVIKVGMASDVTERMGSLNNLNYAGANDWTCLYWANTDNAGAIEASTHRALTQYAHPLTYARGKHTVHCLETFKCPANTGIEQLKSLLSPNFDAWCNDALLEQYRFIPAVGGQFNRAHSKNSEAATMQVKSAGKPETQQIEAQYKPVASQQENKEVSNNASQVSVSKILAVGAIILYFAATILL